MIWKTREDSQYVKPLSPELYRLLFFGILGPRKGTGMVTLNHRYWIYMTKQLCGMIQPGTLTLLTQITNFLVVRDFIVSFEAGLLLQQLLRLSVELENQLMNNPQLKLLPPLEFAPTPLNPNEKRKLEELQEFLRLSVAPESPLMNKPWLKLRSHLKFAPTQLNPNEKRTLEELEAHMKICKYRLLPPFAPKPEPAPTAAVDGKTSLTEDPPEVEVRTGLKPRLEAARVIPIEPVVMGLPVSEGVQVGYWLPPTAEADTTPVVMGLPVTDTENNPVVTVTGTPIDAVADRPSKGDTTANVPDWTTSRPICSR